MVHIIAIFLMFLNYICREILNPICILVIVTELKSRMLIAMRFYSSDWEMFKCNWLLINPVITKPINVKY